MSDRLDSIFPNRRAVIERDRGCAPDLANGFIPAAMLADLSDEQIEALTPRWRAAVQRIQCIEADVQAENVGTDLWQSVETDNVMEVAS